MSAPSPDRLVLLIEDNDDHLALVRRAFARQAPGHELLHFPDGDQALDYLSGDQAGRLPDLILLDLRLHTTSGLDVLHAMKQSERLRAVPVAVWTTSENQQDLATAYERGANAYIVKPGDLTGFETAVRDLTRFWLTWNRTV